MKTGPSAPKSTKTSFKSSHLEWKFPIETPPPAMRMTHRWKADVTKNSQVCIETTLANQLEHSGRVKTVNEILLLLGKSGHMTGIRRSDWSRAVTWSQSVMAAAMFVNYF